jgi:hypothetical protein
VSREAQIRDRLQEETFETTKLEEIVSRDFVHHCFTLEERFVIEIAGVNLVVRSALPMAA